MTDLTRWLDPGRKVSAFAQSDSVIVLVDLVSVEDEMKLLLKNRSDIEERMVELDRLMERGSP